MVDLGTQPLCESFLTTSQLNQMEPHYPLVVMVCGVCHLAQAVHDVAPAAIFDEYAYYSSYSDSWLNHARRYAGSVIERFQLERGVSRVLEIASNDGYLLQYFLEAGIDVVGVDPSSNVAAVASAKGIETIVDFFGSDLASRLVADGLRVDLIVANNVLAHTPEINDLVAGVKILLGGEGVATFEFPHLMRLLDECQFDTIYHEHWSYLSLITTVELFRRQGLTVFDVEQLGTHGGSLRLYVRHEENRGLHVTPAVGRLMEEEVAFGLAGAERYAEFGARVAETKRRLLSLLIAEKDAGRSIAAYGAAGKGNTLLNYCGISTDLVDYVCDRNPYKHGRFTPGSRIPIYGPEMIDRTRPDVVLILPWNLKGEVIAQLAHIESWGGRFLVPIPDPVMVGVPTG